MQYKMIGTMMPAVEVLLSQGEAMYTQSGAMTWMSEGIDMETNMKGGLGKAMGRMFSGESMFMATYTCKTAPQGIIAFASTVPGEILAIDIGTTNGLICQKGAFLVAEPSVQLKAAFTKKIASALFGGEGFILQDISGKGMVFLEVDGCVVEKTLAPGEVWTVDTGNLVGFEKSVQYSVQTVSGIKNVLFGGEGLFVTKLTGPGKVYLQTLNMSDFAAQIMRGMAK